jgi:hypothetical protein
MLEAQFLATIAYYVSELRPEVKVGNIRDLRTGGKDGGNKGLEDQEQGQGDTEERDWSFVRRRCFEGDVQTEVANGGNYVRGTHSSPILVGIFFCVLFVQVPLWGDCKVAVFCLGDQDCS